MSEDAARMTTFDEFWDDNEITEIFLVGFGCAGGQTLADTTGDEAVADEDYCELAEVLRDGLIRTPDDSWTTERGGYGELKGSISDSGKEWTWDGEGKAWDYRGNDYYKIKLFAA